MAEENFSFSLGWTENASRRDSATRYLSVPFEGRAIGAGDVLLLAAGESQPHRIPMQIAQVLACCDGLRTLDAHARQVAQQLQLSPHQAGGLHEPLERLVQHRLLIDESDLIERLRDSVPNDGFEMIDLLFIRTCARPVTLDHLLKTLAEHPSGSSPERCIILDDAVEPADRAAAREVVRKWAPQLDCELRLVDRNGRDRLLDHLAGMAGVDRQRLGWLFEGDPSDHQKTYGTGPNLALLLGAGKRIALMDDDASFRGQASGDSAAPPVFTPESRGRTMLPESATDAIGADFPQLAEQPLALHARYLGQTAGALLSMAGDDVGSSVAQLTPHLLFELLSQPRVRFTSSGVIGDPGTEDLHWLFAGHPEDLRPLCSDSAQAGRERLFRRRLLRCPLQPEASSAFALMTTTLTGIDNRELLLPTAARGRNEDMLLGALAGFLYPGSMQMGLPHGLEHRRDNDRRWTEKAFDRPRRPDRSRYLFSWLEGLAGVVRSGEVDTRVAVLEAALGDLAGEDRNELKSHMARQLIDIQSNLVERLESVRRTLDPPAWLAQDFDRVIRSAAETAPDLDQRLEEEAASVQRFAAGYQASLGDWCGAWSYCSRTDIDSLLANGSETFM